MILIKQDGKIQRASVCLQALAILFSAIKILKNLQNKAVLGYGSYLKLISIFPHKTSDSFYTANEWTLGQTPVEMPFIRLALIQESRAK